MPAHRARLHAVALFGYVCVALVFAWPLPERLGDTLLASPGRDTGVYIWNLWVFRHEIVEHGRFPFYTSEILALSSGAPLTLHNYTSLANIIAFPLLPILGTIATFNVLVIASGVTSAYAAFILFRRLCGDTSAAWAGGLLFGFSPFMTARSTDHFSLAQSAALPAFVLMMDRVREQPTTGRAAAAGAMVAVAFLCDPYYAVYCLLIAAYAAVWIALTVQRGAARAAPATLRLAVNVALMCVGGLVVGIILRGGGRLEFMGMRVSMTRLYTPMLVFTLLLAVRAWIALRPRIGWVPAPLRPHFRTAAIAAATCALVLSPVLTVMAANISERPWMGPRTLWRSSAPGLDLLALLVPNPTGILFGWISSGWLSTMPNGFIENVAAIPWTATFTVAVAILYAGLRVPRYWKVFTAGAAILSLGPFVQIAGWQTYVPTPWAVLRYLPVIGAARMPTRFAILVMLGAAALLAFAVRALRRRALRPWVPVSVVSCCLLVELMPAPRPIHTVRTPSFYKQIRDDPRPVRVLTLPFGLRDGTSSYGDFSASTQFYQTVHEKTLLGGYLSRLPRRGIEPYERLQRLSVLMDLSAGRHVGAQRMERAIERAHIYPPRLDIGYVVIHRERVSPQLLTFARAAFDLEFVTAEEGQELYRTPLATGGSRRRSFLDRRGPADR
jgi:hypothetical protein